MHLHDWEVLEYQKKNDIEERYSLNKKQHSIHEYVRLVICLKCSKIVDEITPYVAYVQEQKRAIEARKVLAKQLYQNKMFKDKITTLSDSTNSTGAK
jgi:hypothetical protein